MSANIVITGIAITPNPVSAGESFLLAVEITDKIYGILTQSGETLITADEKVIERR